MQTTEQIDQLATALAKAQGSMGGALKDSSNPFFKSKYADLESVWTACRKALSENGLSVVQTTSGIENGVAVTTTLLHASGQWMRDTLPLHPKDLTPQGIGSAITYGRRYALAAMVGVYQTDDDAEAAHGRGESTGTHPAREPTGLEGSPLTNEKRDQYLPEMVKYIDASDDLGLRQLWDELSPREQGDIWRFFTVKQKSKARELLQKKAAA